MKKNRIASLFLFAILCMGLQAQTFTIVTNKLLSPGVRYKKVIETTAPWKLYVLEVDLNDSNVGVESVKSSNLYGGALQTLSTMVATHDDTYHNIIGATNGDFFTVGVNANNLQVADGELITNKTSNRSVFALTDDGIPNIFRSLENYTIVLENGLSRKIDNVNNSRLANQLVLYNKFKGSSTGTNPYGVEVKIEPVTGVNGWIVNGSVSCKVLEKTAYNTGGNMSFTSGQAVLSGHGTANTFLTNNVNVGDIITINLGIKSGIGSIKQLVGGFPKIVENGENFAVAGSIIEYGSEYTDYTTERDPHTAIGFSQNNSKLYIVVVDGRSTSSVGMNIVELADYLISIGAYNAINLDGGGSSELIVNDTVQNSPTDGHERALTNALFVYAKTLSIDNFESGLGHFYKSPTFSWSTEGIATTSAVEQVTFAKYCGDASFRARLYDNPSVTTPWTVRLTSGAGRPEENIAIASNGTLSFRLTTNSAAIGATVELWIDDVDGTEMSQPITIINDGQWHEYSFDLTNYNGTPLASGNGQLDADTITIDAIVLKQPNTSNPWHVYIDDVLHDPDGSGTMSKIIMNNTTITDIDKIDILESKSDVVIYPNPNKGEFSIDFKTEKLNDYIVEIFNLSGTKVFSTILKPNELTIDAGELPIGLYFVNIQGQGLKRTTKMSVRK